MPWLEMLDEVRSQRVLERARKILAAADLAVALDIRVRQCSLLAAEPALSNPIEKRMTDPITFNTDKGSVGSSRVKNWLGMDARLGPGTGLGWASLLDALEQIPPDRLVDGFLECAAADPGLLDEFPRRNLVLFSSAGLRGRSRRTCGG
jgi:hypothetical protein